MPDDDDSEYMLPFDQYGEQGRTIEDYNEEVFESQEQAQDVYNWLSEHWNPNEGGFAADDVYDRLIAIEVHYDDDGDIDWVDYDFDDIT